jgi:hypothetical protein
MVQTEGNMNAPLTMVFTMSKGWITAAAWDSSIYFSQIVPQKNGLLAFNMSD